MKRLILMILALTTLSARAEIIDRMVAVANHHVITLSDIQIERQLRMALGVNSPSDDKAIIKDLIDRQIIEDQIAQFPGIEVTDEQVQAEMDKIADVDNLPAEIVREAIRRKLRTAQFFDQRFKQFLQATDEEVREYYDNRFVPEAKKRGLTSIPPLEEVAAQIRDNVIQEKLMRDVDSWLEASRRRSDIEIFD